MNPSKYSKQTPIYPPSFLFLSISVLFLVFLMALFSFVFFYAGLGHDGDRILMSLITNKKIRIEEISRITFFAIYQIPAYLFILFPFSDSLSALIRFFSFGLIMIHVFSILGCYFILPKDKKSFLFFPLLAFIIGPLTALGISICTLISLSSYLWLVGFIIYYSDLSLKTHKALFLLSPILLFLSHEAMSYMGLLFSFFLVLPKLKKEKVKTNKQACFFVMGVLLISSLFAFYFVVFPYSIANRSAFFSGLFFFFADSCFNYPAILGLLLISLSSLFSFSSFWLKKSLTYSLITLIVLLALLTPILDMYRLDILGFDFMTRPLKPSAYSLRVFCAIILPFPFFVWLLYEKKNIKPEKQKLLLFLCCLVSISLLIRIIYRDASYRSYQKSVVSQLSDYKGLVYLNDIKRFSFTPNHLNLFYKLDINTGLFASSILFPMSYNVKAVLFPDTSKNRNKIYVYMKKRNKSYRESLKKRVLSNPNYLGNLKNQNRFFNTKQIVSYIDNSKEVHTR